MGLGQGCGDLAVSTRLLSLERRFHGIAGLCPGGTGRCVPPCGDRHRFHNRSLPAGGIENREGISRVSPEHPHPCIHVLLHPVRSWGGSQHLGRQGPAGKGLSGLCWPREAEKAGLGWEPCSLPLASPLQCLWRSIERKGKVLDQQSLSRSLGLPPALPVAGASKRWGGHV